ncbi:MAG: hypothetical protein WD069_18045 [Planctomycetales bacterium]
MPRNILRNRIHTVQHIVVRISDDTQAESAQVIRSAAIVLLSFIVRTSVDLDHQSCLGAVEIRHERTEGVLTPKLQAGKPARAEPAPEQPFGKGRGAAQGAGSLGRLRANTMAFFRHEEDPPPAPSLKGRGVFNAA